MATFISVLLVACLFGLCLGRDMSADSSLINNERKLYHYLIDDYEKSVRPVSNVNDTVTVAFQMSLLGVEDLDESSQVLSTQGWLHMSWTDTQLTWDPNEYGGVSEIRIPISKLWTPDVLLFNSQSDSLAYGYNELAAVYPSGMVLWIPPAFLKSQCFMDMRKFPYDKHTCHLKFGSWTYHEKLVNLTHQTPFGALDTSYYTPHLEWAVDSVAVKRNPKVYPCCPETYVDITYSITLKRRTTYMSHIFMLPAVLLAFLIPVVFIMPTESGEKFTLGCGILVSLVLLLMMLESFLPTAHPTVPLLGQFYLMCIGHVTICLAISAIVINVWNRGHLKAPMPGILKTIFLTGLAKLMCVNQDYYMPMPNPDHRRLDIMADSEPGANELDDKFSMVDNMTQMASHAQWRQLAVVFDRLCFVVFLLSLIICMITYLG